LVCCAYSLLVDLLFEMSAALGYKFDREEVHAAYAPMLYLTNDTAGGDFRKGVLEIVSGKRPLLITDRRGMPRFRRRM
jgi:hypothetical protein